MLFLLVFALTACGKDKSSSSGSESSSYQSTELSVIMPAGAPTIAQAQMEHSGTDLGNGDSYSVERVSSPTLLATAFSSKSHDIIYAPINLGAKFYNTNQNYVFACGLTWGNLYLAAIDKPNFSLSDLDGNDVYFFGEGTVNDLVISKVLEENSITPSNITWLSATSDTKDQLVSIDQTSIVLLAEPALSAAKAALAKQGKILYSLDVQEMWSEYSQNGSYLQAGVFVKKSTLEAYSTAVNSYLTKLEASCKYVSSNLADVASYCVEAEYDATPEAVLLNSIPNCNIEYKKASLTKTQLETMVSLNLSLFGGKQLDEGFYAF